MAQDNTPERLARIEKLASQGLKPAAAQLSRLILEKDPQNVEALVWLARTTNQTPEADDAVKKAVQLRPDDRGVQELLLARQPAQPVWNGSMAALPNPYAPAYPGPNPYAPPSAPNPYAPPPGPNPYAPPAGAAPYYGPPPGYPQPGYPNGGPMPQYGGQPGYGQAPAQPPSSYDYLRGLGQTAAPPVPPPVPMSAPAVPAMATPVKRGPNAAGVIFGLLFLLAGVALAVLWSLQITGFQDDIGQPAVVSEGQVVELSQSRLVVDVKNQSKRTFNINDQTFKTLEPLVRDSKNNQALAPNTVKINVTPGGRLVAVEVQTPNKGIATVNNSGNGLLGFGAAADWGLTALCGVLALLGLIILSRAFASPKIKA